MKKLNENAATLLNNQRIWYLGTFGAEPNAVPVFFKAIAEDGTLLVADVFMNKTLRNVEANGKVSISACDAQTMVRISAQGNRRSSEAGRRGGGIQENRRRRV